jgi:dTDP-4-amino-4,6-dideoxygalactose transaminase
LKIITDGSAIPFTGLKRQYNNLREEILSATDAVFSSGQLMNGPYTNQFESWLAKKNKASYAVTVHSGTSALEAIAEYFKEQMHQTYPPRVLIPSFTFAATANAFIRAGWEVHFVDTDSNGVMDLDKIPDISYQAVVLVGLYGASIGHLAATTMWRRWNLRDTIVIEDAAQHWLSDNCNRITVSAISFDPMKNLPCYGNGGAVVTDNPDLTEYIKKWRQHGSPSNPVSVGGLSAGTNSRMSELDCSLMLVKGRYIDHWQARRRQIGTYWQQRLTDTPARCLSAKNSDSHAFHKFVIDVDNRDRLRLQLEERKIETKIHYMQPLHEISAYQQYSGPNILSCASALARRVISLPIYPELADSEVEYIIDQVIDCVSQKHS